MQINFLGFPHSHQQFFNTLAIAPNYFNEVSETFLRGDIMVLMDSYPIENNYYSIIYAWESWCVSFCPEKVLMVVGKNDDITHDNYVSINKLVKKFDGKLHNSKTVKEALKLSNYFLQNDILSPLKKILLTHNELYNSLTDLQLSVQSAEEFIFTEELSFLEIFSNILKEDTEKSAFKIIHTLDSTINFFKLLPFYPTIKQLFNLVDELIQYLSVSQIDSKAFMSFKFGTKLHQVLDELEIVHKIYYHHS